MSIPIFTLEADTNLVFMESTKVNAFPCARRKSILAEDSYIPFDPEAKLNTEANNRKHSGLNGFTQSFINTFDEGTGELSFVVNGYYFELKLADFGSTAQLNAFGNEISRLITSKNEGTEVHSIYANIKLANTPLFSKSFTTVDKITIPQVDTKILRDQRTTDDPSACLDFYVDSSDDGTKNGSYYFYGLSFSHVRQSGSGYASLELLKKVDNAWQLQETSKLPKIEHGEDADSVRVPGSFTANSITAQTLTQDSRPVVTLEISDNKYQLKVITK